MKIQTKLTLCISLVVAVPLLIVFVVFSRPLYNMVIADTIRDEQNASALIAPQIENRVEDVKGVMDDIMSSPYYEKLFLSAYEKTSEELSDIASAEEFKKYIDEIVIESGMNAVRLYLGIPKDEVEDLYSNGATRDLFTPEADIISSYWHGIFDGTNYSSLYCPEFYLTRKEIREYGNSAYITRTTIYYDGAAYPVYVAVYYDNNIYKEILKNAAPASGSVSYIINDRNALVVTTNEALSGTYRIKYSDIRDALLASNSFVEREVADVSVYVAFYYIAESGWFMVNVIPKEPLISMANKWMIRFLGICLICFVIATIIAVHVSKSVTKRIAKVSSQMAMVHNGPPVPMKESLVQDEVGELINTYNFMTEEMNDLIKKQEETAEELRVAEFNALQAQINPHFLYNTMDMINWMAQQGRNKEVSEVVQNLSKFYKLTLSRKKDYSTIADELEHAQVYVELQNKRFKDAIDFVIDVPDELTQCRLPRLTFQPILENAILHGILETEEKLGTIVLTAWTEGDDIRLVISDDGAGMDENIRSHILSEERIKPTNSRGANVAIVNIHRRLQLLYGEKYGLSYESSPGNGCEVSILIPYHIGDKAYEKQV